MSIGGKHIIRYYTIVEVMVAMAIFLIMMTIMMQLFSSSQKIWGLASKKNELYASARVAMDLMTREVQSMMYANDDDGTGIYPFWYEWTDVDVDAKAAGGSVPAKLEKHWVDNKDLSEKSVNTAYLTALNFISTTDLKAVDQGSDVCEIRYKFIPVYLKASAVPPYTMNDIGGGKLKRSCTEEYYDDGNPLPFPPTPSLPGQDYNFAANPYTSPPTAGRVSDIWKDPNLSNFNFQTVISGVYSLKFTCYIWNGTILDPLIPMDDTPPGLAPNSTAVPNCDLSNGNPVPVAVRIDMKLMAPNDLIKLVVAICNSEKESKIRNLKQTMRTFSKVIYIGKRKQ